MSSVRIQSIYCDSRKAMIFNSVKRHASPLNIQIAVEVFFTDCSGILKHP